MNNEKEYFDSMGSTPDLNTILYNPSKVVNYTLTGLSYSYKTNGIENDNFYKTNGVEYENQFPDFSTPITLSNTSYSTINLWGNPERVEINVYDDYIEEIFKERYMFSGGMFKFSDRVFKIIYSCVNGKWNKSERIYGIIMPAQTEYYTF